MAGQDGAGLAANHVQGQVVHHFAADDPVEAEVVGVVVAAGLFVAEEVNPELGLGGVPGRAVVKGHPVPQLELPAVGAKLLPVLDAGESHTW